MAKYVFQLSRSIKDDANGIDDWAEYERKPSHIKPLEGKLVIEYDNVIPRLKTRDAM